MAIVDTKFKQIFDLFPNPVLIIQEGIFIYCNNAAVDIMGCENQDQLLQLKPSEISPLKQPDGQDSFHKAENFLAEVDITGVSRFNGCIKKLIRVSYM